MHLAEAVGMVRLFHVHIGGPVAREPRLLRCDPTRTSQLASQLLALSLAATDLGGQGDDLLLSRLAFTLEELAEWLYGHARGDLVAAADAWGDRLYLLLGDAVATGLPAAEVFAEVHASNMSKEAGRTRWHGKGIKGPAFRPPDVQVVLNRAHRKFPSE